MAEMDVNDLSQLDPSDTPEFMEMAGELPTPIELPEGLELSAVEEKARQWNKNWATFYDKKRGNWEDNYKQFKYFDKGLIENTSQKTYEVWANIQTEIPFLVSSIFGKSEIVKGQAKFDDVNGNAYKVNNYINKMILVNNHGRFVASDAIQDFLVFGTVISKTFWDNVNTPEFNIATQTWEDKYEGKPSVYNVDIFNWAIDPTYNGHTVDKAEWTRERIFFKKEDLKKMMEAGEVLEVDDNALEPSKKMDSGKDIRDRIDGLSPSKSEKVYVDEFWCTLHYKDESGAQQSGKFYFWMLNDTTIIKFKPNIFNQSPYKVARCYRLAHEFFGMGDVDVMTSLSEHINVVHSQGAVLAKKTGQKLTILGPGAGVDPQTIKSKENGFLTVKDMNQIRVENTTAGADLEVMVKYKQELKNDLANAVGINDIMRGEPQGDMTATESSILNSNSSARLAMKLGNFQDEWLVPIASSFYDLSKQFIDGYSFYSQDQLISLSQADFEGAYEWSAQGTTALANKNLRIQQMTQMATQIVEAVKAGAQSNGLINMPAFDLGKFLQNEVLSLLEIQNPAQYFFTPPPPMPPMPTVHQVGPPPAPGAPNQPPMPQNLPSIAGRGGNPGANAPMPISDRGLVNDGGLGNMEGAANKVSS